MRPVLLLDVDGQLNPFAAGADAKPPGFVEHRFRLRGWSRRRPLRMWLNPDHGAALLDAAGDAEPWRFAWQRPLVWLDDDCDLYPTARDAFLAKPADVPTALVRVDPRTGLTGEHLAEVRRHLR